MKHVSRFGRVLDACGAVVFLVGAGLVGRAWVGFRAVQGFQRSPGDPPMAAVELADRFWRMQKAGVAVMVVGVALFVAAWWVAGRRARPE